VTTTLKSIGIALLLVLCAPGWLSVSDATMVIQIHRVRAGETLESIANRYGVAVDTICQKNGVPKDYRPRAGQTLVVPISNNGDAGPTKGPSEQSTVTTDAASGRQSSGKLLVSEVYYAKAGDTIESIAGKYGISADTVRQKNALSAKARLQTGQLLVIPIRESIVYKRDDSPERGSGKSAAGVPTASGQKSDGKVVGKLGVISSSGARIRKSASPTGKTVFTCTEGTQLVIVNQKNDWYGVMMIDGSTCWVPMKYVRALGVELVAGRAEPGTPGAGNSYIVNEAYRYLGIPYVYGGTSLGGMDCSAFVRRVYQSRGTYLPRTAAQQFNVGSPVGYEQLEPGDRLYFSGNGYRVDHTAIYIGSGQIIHASGRAGQVTVDNLFNSRLWSTFVGARR